MFSMDDFSQLGQANLEKSIRLSNILMSNAERVMQLRLDVARSILAENTQTAKALSEIRDIQGLIALQQQLSQPAIDKSLGIAKSMYEVASAAQSELNQFLEEQMFDFNKNLVNTLDRAAKSAPAGSEMVMSTIKTTVANMASACDAAMKTAKKVGNDFVAAGVAAAENTAKASGASRGNRKAAAG